MRSPVLVVKLVKMLILLNHMVYLDQTLYTYLLEHCPATGMQHVDKA